MDNKCCLLKNLHYICLMYVIYIKNNYSFSIKVKVRDILLKNTMDFLIL